MRRSLVVLTAVLLVAVAVRVWAQPSKQATGFQGYWMGVDPVDGGDARRSLVRQADGTYALAAHDSVLTLCDGTEHGFGSFSNGEVVDKNVMRSNSLLLECFNNGARVTLHVTFELVEKTLMKETATREDGTPVSTIIFHKVSD